MQCTGAKILMECLVEQGVDTIFGYPGGTILNVYDELYNYEGDGRIKHILTAHEQGACHAADGYARSTGRVGVCFATSGPGCTNLVTGIATAYMDSSPIVCITCNVGTSLLGKDSFQEVDITGITMPITKCNYLVRSVDELADVVREAFAIARSGRPGPVLIDIPKNVTAEKADYEPLPRSAHGTSGRLGKLMKRSSQNFKAPEPDHRDIDKLVEMIAASKKPLLICGGGVVRARAHHEFEALANRIDSPVAITVMGGGGFRGRNPLTTGMIGMHGHRNANRSMGDADLIILCGARVGDRAIFAPEQMAEKAKIVREEINSYAKSLHTSMLSQQAGNANLGNEKLGQGPKELAKLIASLDKQVELKQKTYDRLREEIDADVNSALLKVLQGKKDTLVVRHVLVNINAVDLTEKVSTELKNSLK